ncbi:MAG: hypothetical protein IPP88_21925 [Betaproteobacteria bacterium]|nr:hypothetical protein [Betaproteobacteria bacterium]
MVRRSVKRLRLKATARRGEGSATGEVDCYFRPPEKLEFAAANGAPVRGRAKSARVS